MEKQNGTTPYYGVYDEKTKETVLPSPAFNDDDALRAFATQVNDGNSRLHHHAEDYYLYHVGEFDPVKGVLVGLDKPRLLSSAIALRKSPPGNIKHDVRLKNLETEFSLLVEQLRERGWEINE